MDSKSRVIAESLFPAAETEDALAAVENFADILGIGAEFRCLFKEKDDGSEFRRFLAHFQNNLALLISKTWVEKDDEGKKERLLRQLPGLIALIEKGDYEDALLEFGLVLEDLAFLFFGSQSLKEDFTEYAMRIDPQIGLFWWYGSQLRAQNLKVDASVLRALLLIGICYLTSF
ncbi:MAG: hypothetical protein LBH18_02625 [Spirochaetaceae bacterium]|jgi:hypothetical protein|nr:hypothetical protein [Spirochaetaceae bacterium]